MFGGGTKDLVQLEAHVADVAYAQLRILLQASLEQRDESRWCAGRQRSPLGLRPYDRRDNFRCIRSVEGAFAREHLKSTVPNAQMSARLSIGLPRACSGAM